MTESEKVIWAAAFALEFSRYRKRWTAAGAAADAVAAFRQMQGMPDGAFNQTIDAQLFAEFCAKEPA